MTEVLHLHLNGEIIRVLHIDREKVEATIVYRNSTIRLPLRHLVMIADCNSPEDVEALLILSGVGVGDRASNDSDANIFAPLFAPLTVGDLSKPDG